MKTPTKSTYSPSAKPHRFKKPGDKPAFGAVKPAFGAAKPAFGAKKPFGDKKPYGSKPTFGAKPAFGDKKPYAAKAAFGEKKPYGAKKRTYGEKTFYGSTTKPVTPVEANTEYKSDYKPKKFLRSKTEGYAGAAAPAPVATKTFVKPAAPVATKTPAVKSEGKATYLKATKSAPVAPAVTAAELEPIVLPQLIVPTAAPKAAAAPKAEVQAQETQAEELTGESEVDSEIAPAPAPVAKAAPKAKPAPIKLTGKPAAIKAKPAFVRDDRQRASALPLGRPGPVVTPLATPIAQTGVMNTEPTAPSEAVAAENALTFAEYGLRPQLLKAITELGYTAPTPIQAAALPILLGEPTDLMGLAATGTGKTGAFAIPVLEKIDSQSRETQCLVLCPTRELVLQVSEQFKTLGKHLGVRVLSIFGGAGYGEQIAGIRSGAHVIVATPGRLVDLLSRDKLNLDVLDTLILDEADEMISMGFKDDLEAILQKAPGTQKTWLFSATMSPMIRGIADKYLTAPRTVQINRKEMLSGTVEQFYIATHEYDKMDVIGKIIDAEDDFYGLIFCQTKALVVDVHGALRDRGYPADCLHGDMDQSARETTMRGFRAKKSRILVCTDVACRGLDVKELSHVINYSLPRELDNYVHRIGRTGRAGKPGIAISLVTPSHRGLIYRIEKLTRTEMKQGKLPTRREIAKKRATKLLAEFNALGTQTEANSSRMRAHEVIAELWTGELEGLTAREVAARFFAIGMQDLLTDRA